MAVLIFRRIFRGSWWIFAPRNDRADEMEMIWQAFSVTQSYSTT